MSEFIPDPTGSIEAEIHDIITRLNRMKLNKKEFFRVIKRKGEEDDKKI